jgi:hypothetical protein
VFVAAVALALTPLLAGATSGTWTLATSPNPGTAENSLLGVSCPSAGDCWAVGYQSSSGPRQTLIEHWDGSAWSTVTSGNENNGSTLQNNELSGVTCTSAADCWAVGTFVATGNISFDEPLWEHWDGTSWTASTFVVGVITDYWLNAVSCVDASHCWAVGYKTSGSVTTVWIQQWNGSVWTNDPSTDSGRLNGVSCVDATHCWAVGENNGSPFQTRIEAWNGTTWSAATSPDASSFANTLNGVSCVDTSNCWSAGWYNDGTTQQNLLVRWNGSSWSLASSAASNDNAPTENRNFLEGVTCLSADYCWAVGAWALSGGTDQTLIDRWDGTSWTVVAGTPNSPDVTMNDELRSVACGDTDHCAAAGDTFSPDPTLILQFAVAPTPAPSPTIPVPPTGAAGSLSSGPVAGTAAAALLLGAGLVIVIATGGPLVARRRRLRRP